MNGWRRMLCFSAAAGCLFVPATVRGDDIDAVVRKVTYGCKTIEERAEKLLDAGYSQTSLPVKIGLLERAYKYGLRAKEGYVFAYRALDRLERVAPKRGDEWRQKRLKLYPRMYSSAEPAEKTKIALAWTRLLISTADGQFEQGRTQEAVTTYRQALAKVPAKSGFAGHIREKLKRATARGKLERTAKALKKRLDDGPEDKEIARHLAMLYLVSLNRPNEASKYAAIAQDAGLKKLAVLAGRDPASLSSAECLAVADGYRALIDPKTGADKEAAASAARQWYFAHVKRHEASGASATDLVRIYAQIDPIVREMKQPPIYRIVIFDSPEARQGFRKAVEHLWSLQKQDGRFSSSSIGWYVGVSALITYALLESGASVEDHRMKRALTWLAGVEAPMTYALGLRCNVWLEANRQAPGKYVAMLRKDVEVLIKACREGHYGYSPPKYGSYG